MSTTSLRFSEMEPQQRLKLLRNQTALVRALLDKLDEVTSTADASLKGQHDMCAQVAEEVTRLASRMLECADAITGEDDVPSAQAARPNGETRRNDVF